MGRVTSSARVRNVEIFDAFVLPTKRCGGTIRCNVGIRGITGFKWETMIAWLPRGVYFAIPSRVRVDLDAGDTIRWLRGRKCDIRIQRIEDEIPNTYRYEARILSVEGAHDPGFTGYDRGKAPIAGAA